MTSQKSFLHQAVNPWRGCRGEFCRRELEEGLAQTPTKKSIKGSATIFIRQELPSDYDEVYNLVKQTFATTSYGDGTEADYLNDVRKKDTFLPELSLVAEDENGKILGQIVLYQTLITTESGKREALVLSPLSVLPQYFRKGIGRSLIDEAVKRAAVMKYIAVFLCGEPALYQKFGFKPSFEFEIYHKENPTAQWCMGRELFPNSLANIRGTIDIV